MIRFDTGLTTGSASPALGPAVPRTMITEEAGVSGPQGLAPRVTLLVNEGEAVLQGAPVVCLRDAPDVSLVAPMPARVARIALRPGRKLSEIVLFHEANGDILRHRYAGAETETGLRHLMQGAGLWPWIRRRPFGGMPEPDERPAAIVVMAADTRLFAPDPRLALAGREEAVARGLKALTNLTDGPVFFCMQSGRPILAPQQPDGRIHVVECGTRHPQASAGFCIHGICPATLDRPVWDIHGEDTAALGELLDTGVLPMTRLVSVAGGALREARLVRTQPGADLRELTQRLLRPGSHVLLSGSPIGGQRAQWLGTRDRQISALAEAGERGPRHWLVTALTRSATAKPVIPTAALDEAFGRSLPVMALVRALSVGDYETAIELGALSLLEEDMALADYVLGGEAGLVPLLRNMLDGIRKEFAA